MWLFRMGVLSITSLLLCLTLKFSSSAAATSSDIGSICQSMWDADTNSLVYGVDYTVNIQNKAQSYQDTSPARLFTYVNEIKLRGPTFTAFKNLMDNYIMSIGITERLTTHEKNENRRFLKDIMATRTIKKLHDYLASKVPSKVPPTQYPDKFEQMLYKMWFYFYSRGAYRDSSGFEHVFLGEKYSKDGNTIIKGFHNWLQFYLEEKANSLNYHGYYTLMRNGPSRLKLKFDVDKYDKPVSSFFLGTSPEFELGIYTACFILRPGLECSCRINSETIKIMTYGQSSNKYIGTAYPVV